MKMKFENNQGRLPVLAHRLARTATALLLALFVPALTGAAETPPPVTVSQAQALWLGERALEEHLDNHPQATDSRMALRVDRIGRRVARLSDRPGVLYRFMVLQGDRPDASSFPGGTICITEAAVRLYNSDDELAFALGHEVAHIALGHNVTKYQLTHLPAMEDTPEKAMLQAVRASFSRLHELDADRYGALYAVRAGYKFSASLEALRKLAATYGVEAEDAEHPSFSMRIERLARYQADLEEMVSRFELGTEALKEGRPEDAIAALQYFLAEFPHSAAGQVNIGSAYLARIRKTAPLELAEVLPILPEAGVLIRRGRYDRKDLEAARSHFTRALQVEPREVYALAGLALVSLRTKDFATAEQRLREALDLQPRMPDLHLLLGNARYLAGDFDGALVRYRVALAEYEWPEARKNIALTLERLGRLDEAIEMWRGLRIDPGLREEAVDRIHDLERRTRSPE